MREYIKRNYRSILEAAAVMAATLLIYVLLHKAGTAARGYQAIGGEIFAFAIPFIYEYMPKRKKRKAAPNIKHYGDVYDGCDWPSERQ